MAQAIAAFAIGLLLGLLVGVGILSLLMVYGVPL